MAKRYFFGEIGKLEWWYLGIDVLDQHINMECKFCKETCSESNHYLWTG